MQNTLVSRLITLMGSQWVVFVATVVNKAGPSMTWAGFTLANIKPHFFGPQIKIIGIGKEYSPQ